MALSWKRTMRIAFAGTPTFAATILAELLRRHFNVVSVLTQPDAPSGRGLKSGDSPVKQLARQHDIAVQQPETLKNAAAVADLNACRPDVLVVVAYGLILPADVLTLPTLGCINVHASLLPRWRGAAPIQRAIMAGDVHTGICIMQMDAGLDTGPVFTCCETPMDAEDTAGTLHDRLATMGAQALCAVLDDLRHGRAQAQPQPSEGITYAAKILKPDMLIDWRRPAVEIERQLRALDPAPGAQTLLGGQSVKLWRALALPQSAADAPVGSVIASGPEGLDVRCGDGVLRVTELQRAGGRRLRAVEFLRGFKLTVGDRFGEV